MPETRELPLMNRIKQPGASGRHTNLRNVFQLEDNNRERN